MVDHANVTFMLSSSTLNRLDLDLMYAPTYTHAHNQAGRQAARVEG